MDELKSYYYKLLSSPTERTFQFDDDLPSLPVPSIGRTLEKYLDSVKAIASDEQLDKTKKCIENFKNGIGSTLQLELQEKAKANKNWLEEWWLNYAYLYGRNSLMPYSNMASPIANLEFWQPKTGTRPERSAAILYSFLMLWKLIRDESLEPIRHRDCHWTMYQFKKIFNSARIPGELKDDFLSPFQTKFEGPLASTKIVIMCRGYIFTAEVIDKSTEEPYSPHELKNLIQQVEDWCAEQTQTGQCVGTLTLTDRSKWHDNRGALIQLDPLNAKHLEEIENSLLVLILDDWEGETDKERDAYALTGESPNRWTGKTINLIALRNGLMCGSYDHTDFDGSVLMVLVQIVALYLSLTKGCLHGIEKIRENLPKVEPRVFALNDKLTNAIQLASQESSKALKDLNVIFKTFNGFGKKFITESGFHPESFIQIAIQLSYYKMHKKFAPCYAAAVTRKFYNARTETIRSCTAEVVEFCKAMVSGTVPKEELKCYLMKCGNKFQKLLKEAMNGEGCDRHLLALSILAKEAGGHMPDLFTDPMFTKSGGNGNFILSTSCLGQTFNVGSMPPMVTNGYSVFYGFLDGQIAFSCCNYLSSETTDAEMLLNTVFETFKEFEYLCR